ncbi:DegT/DnrJ/EryC1/StrS family aminotransferase [Pseudoalteromonas denitrificans]|uniref:dTDP-4-amino-4,6-dideoxygalactose transaminase n=1 Tax=Pseudoalteromonas denitrificans DSM 6059 TaxID=1123010 RepID=A0A1I1HKI6_9GAMM|nr:DegT/DnrJ/EryC1/StrS aminotransferase family protein [Pseudoalteromonas denitrificans]SFC24265.1 dTDP-4-amino-4,6-dideoxygalactose transaminase [Pseudoalteromonas denitrificans DSM 6059]
MNNFKTIPHNKPTMGIDEASAAQSVIISNDLVKGYHTQAFEDDICEYLGLPQGHAVCVTSGSAALFIALKTLKLKNKTVAIPSYACSSLKHACTLNQADIIYLDNKKNSVIFDSEQKKFDALIHPYLYGLSSKLPSCNQPIIEDLAQALGASTNNKMLGTMGELGVLSFYATKMISSGGQGGMLVSKSKNLIEQAKDYIKFDQQHDNNARFNFHITEVQAAIGRVQLKKLPEFIKQRQIRWQIYKDAGLTLLDNTSSELSHVRYRAIVLSSRYQKVIHDLKTKGITAINPFESNELLDKHCINANSITQKTVSLPLYPSLSIEDTHFIAMQTKKVLEV